MFDFFTAKCVFRQKSRYLVFISTFHVILRQHVTKFTLYLV